MRFSIAVPQFGYTDFDRVGMRSYVGRAEELGFEGIWTLEQTIGRGPLLAPLELLSYCAAHTERLRLGAAVLVTFQPKPVQRPHPPIWCGGMAPKALARAVRLGDAFMGAGASNTEAFAGAVSIVRRELDEQRKDPAQFPISKRVYLMVDDDAARARERVLDGLHRLYGQMPGLESFPVSGTPDDVARGLNEVIDSGAQTLLLNPLALDVRENREQMERLAAEVIP